MSRVAVVGGTNLDVGGTAYLPLIPADSNPGRVRMSPGGVGRNIAHNLALLGLDTGLVTVLGDDVAAGKIAASCGELGIDLSRALRLTGASTSTYLYITGPDGDLALAVSDMDLCDRLTPEVLAPRLDWLNRAQALVVDANIPEASIDWLCRHAEVPVFADPVSVTKAEKLRSLLGRIDTLKPNRLEAEALSGIPITDEASLNRAADVLLETGLRRLFLTLGAGGLLAADGHQRLRLQAPPGKPVNTTGCGDAFTAALVWARLQGADLEESALAGQAASAIAMESADAFHSAMSAEALQAGIRTLSESRPRPAPGTAKPIDP